MINLEKKMLAHFDWFLFAIMLVLIAFGLVAIANAESKLITGDEATLVELLRNVDWYYVQLQATWFALGLGLMAVVLIFDYRYVGELTLFIFLGMLILLGVVLLQEAGRAGNTAWFKIGEVRTFQPSEMCKLAFIMVLAWHLSRHEPIRHILGFAPILLYILLPVALVVLEKDVGTALVYVAIVLGMLFMSGMSLKLFFGMIISGTLLVMPLWFVIGTNRQNRIIAFLDPSFDPLNAGFNVAQAKIAVGSGQWLGKGLFTQGQFSQMGYLPESHTDFIFAVTAEAVGFVGCAVLIVFLLLLLVRMVHIASTTEDRYGRLIIAGVISMLLFHMFENIGMNIGVMPVTGIPLPFISYGGSNLWANMIAVALVLNVGMRRGKKPI